MPNVWSWLYCIARVAMMPSLSLLEYPTLVMTTPRCLQCWQSWHHDKSRCIQYTFWQSTKSTPLLVIEFSSVLGCSANSDKSVSALFAWKSLQWHHNKRDGVSNHQLHDCLLNRLFRHRSKKTSKLRVTCLCEGNSPVTGEFPTQRTSNAEIVSIWWRHHVRRSVSMCQWIDVFPGNEISDIYIYIYIYAWNTGTTMLCFGDELHHYTDIMGNEITFGKY